MIYEYTWCELDPELLNRLGKAGWRVVPGGVSPIGLLMERERPGPQPCSECGKPK